jgi:hypothetical protein
LRKPPSTRADTKSVVETKKVQIQSPRLEFKTARRDHLRRAVSP